MKQHSLLIRFLKFTSLDNLRRKPLLYQNIYVLSPLCVRIFMINNLQPFCEHHATQCYINALNILHVGEIALNPADIHQTIVFPAQDMCQLFQSSFRILALSS